MKILTEKKVCDGYDVTVLTDQGETVVWHWAEMPRDVETACAGVQKDWTARLELKPTELEEKKIDLEGQVAQMESSLTVVKAELSSVKAAIAAATPKDGKG